MSNYGGSPDVYADSLGNPRYLDRGGRKFQAVGIGTIGWSVETLYEEIDDKGNPVGTDFAKPIDWYSFDETSGTVKI
jgi:hypothetical protein